MEIKQRESKKNATAKYSTENYAHVLDRKRVSSFLIKLPENNTQ